MREAFAADREGRAVHRRCDCSAADVCRPAAGNQCCRDRSLVDGAIGDRDRVGELRQVAFRGGALSLGNRRMRGWNRRGGSRSTVLGAAYPIREGGGERLKGGCRCQVKGLRHVGGSAFSGQIHT